MGQPLIYPRHDLSYCANFLNMMFDSPVKPYQIDEMVVDALNKLLILHGDHEQNCSTATVRMVGSARANLYASISAGIGALWGPLHGGANQEVMEMLDRIQREGGNYRKYIEQGQGPERSLPAGGFRPPGLQEPRPALPDHQEGLRRGAGRPAHDRRPAAGHCQGAGGGGLERRILRRAASSIRTSIFTAASSIGPWASPPTCSR